jgi:hypothetical protein
MKDVPNSDLFYSDLLVSGVHSTFKIYSLSILFYSSTAWI